MGTYINGLCCMPYYSLLPEYVDSIYTASNSFIQIAPQTKSITLSAISGGGGGGCGGVHNTTSTIGKTAPAAGGGGGSGYISTSNITTANLLALVGDTSFVSGYEYGLSITVGAGGTGDYYQSDSIYGGTAGGGSSINLIKRNASTKAVTNTVSLLSLTNTGKGGKDGGGVTTASTKINGGAGGAGGYGGRGGRAGYTYNGDTGSANGANGASTYDTSVKQYLFNDANSKIILGKGGSGGSGFWGGTLEGYGMAPASGEVAYGGGGAGGISVGINNENALTNPVSGGDGASGVVGVRVFYR